MLKEILTVLNSDNPSQKVYEIARQYPEYCKWAERVIENDKVGNAPWFAYLMVQYRGSDRAWAEKVIENSNSDQSDSAIAAYWMVRDFGSNREWAERIIENTKSDDTVWAAYNMVEYCGSNQEWLERVKYEQGQYEKNQEKQKDQH